MNIALETKWEHFLEEKLKAGLYASPADVIQDALQLLQERDEGSLIDLDELERLVAPAIADSEAGRYRVLDQQALKNYPKEVEQRCLQKLADLKKTNPG